ncbi:hypothetical protein V1477_004723 [Vespula maculifrons]|uniref:Uncharacterized protein n=1 Tax=Vespula maculifrons TaxID=7453 RepID=A0ABD2CMM4_VESMC
MLFNFLYKFYIMKVVRLAIHPIQIKFLFISENDISQLFPIANMLTNELRSILYMIIRCTFLILVFTPAFLQFLVTLVIELDAILRMTWVSRAVRACGLPVFFNFPFI